MVSPYTKADIIPRLVQTQRDVADTIVGMSAERYAHETETTWSPAGYLKHLLLSNKPFIKAINLPKEQLQELFGIAAAPSRSYDALVTLYTEKLAEGIKAEDFSKITPVSYRIPENITDKRTYLLELWDAAHAQLYTILETWSEDELDRHQLPHPAIGMLTIREMLFFTLYHNTMHLSDIRQGAT